MRLPIAARLATLLAGMAALSLGLAFSAQDRVLREDLEAAARTRLHGSVGAAQQLLDEHLRELGRRWTAVSRTPEFRANLEVAHAANLAQLADRLRSRDDAAAVIFTLPSGAPMAQSGPPEAVETVLAHWRASPGEEERAALLGLGEGVLATLALPLRTGSRHVGTLLLAEPIRPEHLARWSQVAGAELGFVPATRPQEGRLSRTVRSFGEWELRAVSSFDPEQAALAHARRVALLVGGLALALATALSVLVARTFVAPIRRIQQATERLGRGELDARLDIRRHDEIGDVARVFDSMLDRLRRSQARLRAVQHVARFADWSLDAETAELEGSPELRPLLALPDGAGPLGLRDLADRVHPADRDELLRGLETCRRDGRPLEIDVRVSTPTALRTLHLQARRVSREGGLCVEGSLQDVTERHRAEEQIRYLALHDPLTGLGNRRLFSQRLELALSEPMHRAFAVCFIDLDRFKLVNDTLGHAVGDELLRETAARILGAVEGEEEGAAVARVGGDEFTVLVPGSHQSQDLERLGDRMLQAIQGPAEIQGQEVVVSASIGIACWPEHGRSAEELLRSCDTALHQAKTAGHGGCRIFDVSMREATERRWTLESGLRRALRSGELRVHYQPRVCAENGRIVGFEALLRWRDEVLGALPPDEFVPIAEETGLIAELGVWVLERVLQDLRDWSEEGRAPARISLNVSGRQLRAGFVDTVRTLLEGAGIEPGRLELEVTESALIEEETTAVSVIAELRALGVRVALDDFGTGYSSLSYLRSLPIDVLKIDRAFVRHAPARPEDAALISAIVSMAKTLGLEVVAEGVESREQWDTLLELGCDELQGYLFGEAVPASEVPRLLRESSRRRRKRRGRG